MSRSVGRHALMRLSMRTSTALMTGAAAGLAGALGLVVYLRALAIGPMGVASPLAGVVGAVIPVVVGIGLGERPAPLAVVGIVLGVVTIGMTSWTVGTGRRVQDLAGRPHREPVQATNRRTAARAAERGEVVLADEVTGGVLHQHMVELCGRLGIRRPVRLKVSAGTSSPLR
jgi:hypothetical protein